MHECKIELSLEVWWAYANLFKALELAMFIFFYSHISYQFVKPISIYVISR